VVDKSENKTKNECFLEMLAELLAWGLPANTLVEHLVPKLQFGNAYDQAPLGLLETSSRA
jgi:hypothetical protein